MQEQVAELNAPPFKHDNKVHWEVVIVVVVVTGCGVMAFVVPPVLTSQRMPVYCDGQIHVHEFAIKNPPFLHELKPHLQISWLHIFGQ